MTTPTTLYKAVKAARKSPKPSVFLSAWLKQRALQGPMTTKEREASDKEGNTPLMLALRTLNLASVKRLIEAGCSLEAVDRSTSIGQRTCSPVLALIGATADPNLNRTARLKDDLATLDFLLAQGASTDGFDEFGRTALMAGIVFNLGNPTHAVAVSLRLIAAGADPNGCGRGDWAHTTPLMMAALFCAAPAVDALLVVGADPLRVDENGNTAAERAEHEFRFVLGNPLIALMVDQMKHASTLAQAERNAFALEVNTPSIGGRAPRGRL